VALTRSQLEAAVYEHMRAERERDMDALREQLDEDVEYLIKTPAHPDDPTPHGHFAGSETYIGMWERLYTIFATYEIEIDDIVLDTERGQAFVMLQITAVPGAEWNGLPAGEPIRWYPAAVCVFDDDGHMLSETVYGSFPPIMDGYRRVQAFLASRT
jgi:SnoaL-like domain